MVMSFGFTSRASVGQRIDVHRVAVCRHGRMVDLQAIKPGAPCVVVGHVAADGGGWGDDGIAGLGQRHEAVEVGDGA
jgi:hypothetical protein